MNRLLRHSFTALLFFMLMFQNAPAWGGRTHMWISRSATAQAALLMPGWEPYAGVLSRLSIGPDIWKNDDPAEAPRHFIDLETYDRLDEFQHPDSAALPPGESAESDGIVPWVITGLVDRLSNAMRTNNWTEAAQVAGALAHYAGDLCMPLHTTSNYDGLESGNDGIHTRWETEMPRRKMKSRRFANTPPVHIPSLWPSITGELARAHGFVPDILNADDAAQSESDGMNREDIYYDVLWAKTRFIFIGQMERSAAWLASLWYTAWVNAGSPPIPPPPDNIHFDSIHPRTTPPANRMSPILAVLGISLALMGFLFILLKSLRQKP